MTSEFIQDVFAAVVPERLEGADLEVIVREFRVTAHLSVLAQYVGSPFAAVEFHSMDWLITKDPDEVEQFQPAHDCEKCRSGNEQIRAYLTNNPGRTIALANINYMETTIG